MPSKLDAYRTSVFGDDPSVISNNEMRDANFQEYLRNQRLTRASLSRRDLQQHTDVKFFVSSNFANLISFATVLAVSFCLGWMGWGRDVKGSYKEISDQYETLFTPVYWIIPSLWGTVIFTETIYIICTFLNSFSHLPIVKEAIGFHMFYINCCQIGWIVSYCLNFVWLATLWMGVTVILLIWLNFNLCYQDYISRSSQRTMEIPIFYEWILFRLPFQLHFAWGFFVLLLNSNETALALDWTSALTQIALISVVALWVIGIFVLFYPKSPIFAIPLLLAIATAGVWINLRNPSKILIQVYGERAIQRMHGGIAATCIEHLILAVIRFVFFFSSSYRLLEKE